MFTRAHPKPKGSILLLGPRGVGKSTWIQQNFPKVPTYDLLNSREAISLLGHPDRLYDETKTLPTGSWVVIDEVQKVPALMDEVHRLIEKHKLNFILSGSSARKLKKGSANLLAGRAIFSPLFPLVSHEVGATIQLQKVCSYGMLPKAYLAESPQEAQDYLDTYVNAYLQEEIKGEALTRNLAGFARFLEIAARQNAQITNISNISKDAMVARLTVQGYFEILCDTMLGSWLQPWKLRSGNKQVLSPKFYFFDSGVARAMTGRLAYPPTPDELGFLFETYIFHEVKTYLSYSRLKYNLYYWRSYDDVEVDLICETKKGFVAIEIKSTDRWEKRFHMGFARLKADMKSKLTECYGVFTGDRASSLENIKILPFNQFLKNFGMERLFRSCIISSTHSYSPPHL
ncbi:MAG: ATP-binding protein [Deltaproteobacteria bacterium]|nr:MAG: ATP-binding protein [Deltaproteobacteria bacterium]